MRVNGILSFLSYLYQECLLIPNNAQDHFTTRVFSFLLFFFGLFCFSFSEWSENFIDQCRWKKLYFYKLHLVTKKLSFFCDKRLPYFEYC